LPEEENTQNGTDGDDVFIGSWADDTLNGGLGEDTLYGGSDDDITVTGDNNTLFGGDGDDRIVTDGSGNHIEGGAGVDTFIVGNDPAAILYRNWRDYDYRFNCDTVTITDFDPATETLRVDVMGGTIDQTLLSSQSYGDDLWVVLSAPYGQDFVVAISWSQYWKVSAAIVFWMAVSPCMNRFKGWHQPLPLSCAIAIRRGE